MEPHKSLVTDLLLMKTKTLKLMVIPLQMMLQTWLSLILGVPLIKTILQMIDLKQLFG